MATKVRTVEQLFELKIQELYDIETQIEKALRKLVKKASTDELRAGFEKHLEETRGQIARLEEAFQQLEVKPKKYRSEGIRGILLDGETIATMDIGDELRDSMLAASARYVEHFEMAGYLSAISQAELVGQQKIAELLKQSLTEEEATDEKLAEVGRVLDTSNYSTEEL